MRSEFRLAPLLIVPLLALSSCRGVDSNALHKLACQQAAASFDLQSVSQLDALRKALGVAPGVDPLSTCRDLGVDMSPKPGAANGEKPGSGDGGQTGSGNGEKQGSGDAKSAEQEGEAR